MDDSPKIKNRKSTFLIILLALVLVTAVSAAGYFYLKVRKLETITPGQNDSRKLLEQVSKLIILPQDEEPTIATVTGTEQLKGQAFFANAVVGDKVIIYTNAKKAILFRPSVNKIVEVAPLNLGAPAY